jgi:hypothetical protein
VCSTSEVLLEHFATTSEAALCAMAAADPALKGTGRDPLSGQHRTELDEGWRAATGLRAGQPPI